MYFVACRAVLQFGDFYSALTSVWLTAFIVANPSVSEEISSAICIGGAVGIAMAVHYNPTSLASFAIPIVCGLGLIAICWVTIKSFRSIMYNFTLTWYHH